MRSKRCAVQNQGITLNCPIKAEITAVDSQSESSDITLSLWPREQASRSRIY